MAPCPCPRAPYSRPCYTIAMSFRDHPLTRTRRLAMPFQMVRNRSGSSLGRPDDRGDDRPDHALALPHPSVAEKNPAPARRSRMPPVRPRPPRTRSKPSRPSSKPTGWLPARTSSSSRRPDRRACRCGMHGRTPGKPRPLNDAGAMVFGWRDPDQLRVWAWMFAGSEGWAIQDLPRWMKFNIEPSRSRGIRNCSGRWSPVTGSSARACRPSN